ncbi:MAG: DUF1501 domain-containing protein [Planctomycetota bacterium]
MIVRRHQPSRRDFLRLGAGAGLTAATVGTFSSRQLLHAASSVSGYRALVVMYLAGGNDSFNMLVPTDSATHDLYSAARQNLAIAVPDLLSISPATPDGHTYGIHPSMTGVHQLFNDSKLAFLLNHGTLVEPINKTGYQNASAAQPAQLFSHNDQQAQSMYNAVDSTEGLGWGGVMADGLAVENGSTPLNPGISVSGSTALLRGNTTDAYHLGNSGPEDLNEENGTKGDDVTATLDELRQQSQSNAHAAQFAKMRNESIEISELISTGLDGAAPLATVFPEGTSFGSDLQMIARMIQIRASLGMQRQVFFASGGGWDTHSGQLNDQPNLLSNLSADMAAFQAAMEELGVQNEVTVLVISEFGRTLTSNGQGSDHGWGGHGMVMGGAVRGGDLYGTYPNLTLDGPDDTGGNRGRTIPTTANDQVVATIARWMGVAPADLPALLPNLGNFASDDLGFMA